MKKLAFSLIAIAAALSVAVLAACSSDGLTDFGWAKFKMPEGYVEANGLVDEVTISTSADTDPLNFKLDDRTIQLRPKVREQAFPSAEAAMTAILEKNGGGKVQSFEAGGRTWYAAPFSVKNEGDSVYGYTDVNTERCVGFNAYYMGIDDPDLLTVLETLEIDESKLP